MLSHVIHEHMVLNIVLCKISFSHEESKDLPDKPFQLQHYSFPPRSFGKSPPEKTGFFSKHLGFIVSHGFIMMQLMILLSAFFVAKL